jgi:hypothetical protein
MRLAVPEAAGRARDARQYGKEMANWRVGSIRLGIALSIAWIIGWLVFFVRLAAFESPTPLDYLTMVGITVGPPGAAGLIGWVMKGFRAQ